MRVETVCGHREGAMTGTASRFRAGLGRVGGRRLVVVVVVGGGLFFWEVPVGRREAEGTHSLVALTHQLLSRQRNCHCHGSPYNIRTATSALSSASPAEGLHRRLRLRLRRL